MNTSLRHFFQSRITQSALLLTLLAAVTASIAWSNTPEARFKLGGTWVGRNGDITWTGTYVPDSDGKNAVVTLQWMTLGADFEALLGSVGAAEMSLASGYVSLTGKDTASGKLIWYLVAPGTASATQPARGQVKAIAVMLSDWRFTTPTTAEGKHNLKMYLPDAQGSMLPAPDAVPFLDLTFEGVPHQKLN
jgi:hypothetical protein